MNALLEIVKNALTEAGVPSAVLDFVVTYFFYSILGCAIMLVVFAFLGYRIYRTCLPIFGAIAFGTIGFMFIGPLITGALGNTVNIGLDITATVGWLCAAAGAVLMGLFYKLALFINGAAVGYFVGSAVFIHLGTLNPSVTFFSNQVAYYAVSILTAILLAIVFVFVFKYIYIFVTSVGGLSAVGIFLGATLTTNSNPVVLYICLGLGVIAGIFALVYQLRHADVHYY